MYFFWSCLFIHVVGCRCNLFIFSDMQCSILRIYHNLCIHFTLDGYLNCLHFWAILNNTIINVLTNVHW